MKFKKILIIIFIFAITILFGIRVYSINKDNPYTIQEQYYDINETVNLNSGLEIKVLAARLISEDSSKTRRYSFMLALKNNSLNTINCKYLIEGNDIFIGLEGVPFYIATQDDEEKYIDFKNDGYMLKGQEEKTFNFVFELINEEYKKYIIKEPLLYRINWNYYSEENNKLKKEKKMVAKAIILEKIKNE